MKPFVYRTYRGQWVVSNDAELREFTTWREAYRHAFNVSRRAGTERLLKAIKESVEEGLT